jgi:hypothetical protein
LWLGRRVASDPGLGGDCRFQSLHLSVVLIGKTRLAEMLIAQDIGRGEVVIVFDPKGDVDLLRRVFAKASGLGEEGSSSCSTSDIRRSRLATTRWAASRASPRSLPVSRVNDGREPPLFDGEVAVLIHGCSDRTGLAGTAGC